MRVEISRSETIRLGAVEFRVRHWGDPDAPLLFMFHGWMDCAATFQFVVDAFVKRWHVVAPDLRGHGGSHHNHGPSGADSEILKGFSEDPQELQMRFALLRNLKHVQLQDAGHNLQHDQPEQVARLIEEFLPQ